MPPKGKVSVVLAFAAGAASAALVGWAMLLLGEYSLLEPARVAESEGLGIERANDGFQSDALLMPPLSDDDLPYDERTDAALAVDEARAAALREGKFLMVTFGANWCLDCRTLHRNLKSADVADYTRELFHFVNVNVGKLNQNRDLANELGVDLRRGIPVAIFYGPEGRLIGTTNDGQLEPARLYSSKQILKFVRDVAERSLILPPDSVN